MTRGRHVRDAADGRPPGVAPASRGPVALRNLTRVERPGKGNGWQVALIRKRRRYGRYFADSVWGGKAKALSAAQAWRDATERRIPPDVRIRRQIPRNRPRNGRRTVGVWIERHRVGGRRYHRVVASWPDWESGRRPHRRRFLVERYGLKEALALAVAARREGVREAYHLAHQYERTRRRAGRKHV